MTDITARLRRLYIDTGSNYVQEAADEIETLRQRVKDANHGAERNAIINRELAQELAALKQGQGKPVAWMTEDGMRVATAETKESAMANPSKSAFCIPLYTSAPTIPVGYVLVPVEATYEMREAVRLATESEGLTTTAWQRNAICAAMLSAAPKPKGETE